MNHCEKRYCIFYGLTIITNISLILFALYIFSTSYGNDKFLSLLIAIPPLLSLMTLKKGIDKEERSLKKRLRKAQLRKELDNLKPFDKKD